MSKVPVKVQDAITAKLADDSLKVIDINVENAIIETFLDGRPWPQVWKRMSFDPANEMSDTVKVLAFFWPDSEWGLRCIEPGKVYSAWVEDDTLPALSFCAERALLLAMWTRWRIDHEDEKGDL